ncbi:hypothetical protein OAA60_06625 [Porticoccaceae bacterium]|nr:hypothetical protein [Porticoccaceae bacterium]
MSVASVAQNLQQQSNGGGSVDYTIGRAIETLPTQTILQNSQVTYTFNIPNFVSTSSTIVVVSNNAVNAELPILLSIYPEIGSGGGFTLAVSNFSNVDLEAFTFNFSVIAINND